MTFEFVVRRSGSRSTNAEPRARTILSKMLLDDVDDLLRPAADLVLVLAFEHHAQQRLGARVAHEQPALAGDARFDARDRRRRPPARSADRPSRARARSAAPADRSSRSDGEIGERPAGQRDRPQHVQRRAQAVAGEQIVGEDDVARLLAAERQAALQHLLHHVLVADRACAPARCRARCSASSRPMLLITVATIASPFSRPSRCSCRPHISSTASPSTIAPAVIDEDRAVAVAVERHAHAGSRARRPSRASSSGMRRAAVEVDVAAVGLIADHDRRRSRGC